MRSTDSSNQDSSLSSESGLIPPSPTNSAVWAWISQHPFGWTAIALYLAFRTATASGTKRAASWGPRILARLVGWFFTRLLSVVGRVPVSMKPPPKGVDPAKQYVVVWHPHGSYTTMAFMHCGHQSMQSAPLTWFPGIAPMLFMVPGFREAALLLNARSCQARVMNKLLEAGLTIGLQPGGIAEQLQSDHRREIAVFPPRLGFVRLAMQHGVDLLPVYIFGENQAYDTSDFGRYVSKLIYRTIGVPLAPIQGRWGLPWLVPKGVPIHVRWGNVVSVGAPNATPTDDQVEEVFTRYVTELCRVFDHYKDECLPPSVAARGLTISRRQTSGDGDGAKATGDATSLSKAQPVKSCL